MKRADSCLVTGDKIWNYQSDKQSKDIQWSDAIHTYSEGERSLKHQFCMVCDEHLVFIQVLTLLVVKANGTTIKSESNEGIANNRSMLHLKECDVTLKDYNIKLRNPLKTRETQ